MSDPAQSFAFVFTRREVYVLKSALERLHDSIHEYPEALQEAFRSTESKIPPSGITYKDFV